MQYEVQSIDYHIREQQFVKCLLEGCNLISKNICEKLVGWKSLLNKITVIINSIQTHNRTAGLCLMKSLNSPFFQP